MCVCISAPPHPFLVSTSTAHPSRHPRSSPSRLFLLFAACKPWTRAAALRPRPTYQPRHPASESATPARAGAAQRNNSHYHHRPSSTTPTHKQPSSVAPLLRAPVPAVRFHKVLDAIWSLDGQSTHTLSYPSSTFLLHSPPLSSSRPPAVAQIIARPFFQLKPGTENFLPAKLPSNSSHPRHTIPPRTEKPPSCHPQGAVAPERSLSMYPNSMISRMSLERAHTVSFGRS